MYVIPRKEEKISGSTYATRRVAISPTLHTEKKKYSYTSAQQHFNATQQI